MHHVHWISMCKSFEELGNSICPAVAKNGPGLVAAQCSIQLDPAILTVLCRKSHFDHVHQAMVNNKHPGYPVGEGDIGFCGLVSWVDRQCHTGEGISTGNHKQASRFHLTGSEVLVHAGLKVTVVRMRGFPTSLCIVHLPRKSRKGCNSHCQGVPLAAAQQGSLEPTGQVKHTL